MDNKLYVGNVSWNANEGDLESVFTPYGEVKEVKIIYDRETNRSKGFGFVTFSSSDEAKLALEKVNETDFMGRNLRVSIAEDRRASGGAPRERSGGGYNSGRGFQR